MSAPEPVMAGDFVRSPEWQASRAKTLIEAQATLARPIRDYPSLRKALAARRTLLGLRQLDADEIAGLPQGYVGKLEIGTKNVGQLSFQCLLGALAAELYLVPRVETGD